MEPLRWDRTDFERQQLTIIGLLLSNLPPHLFFHQRNGVHRLRFLLL
jgi:hypothetical protein